MTGRPSASASMRTTRQALGEARQHQGPRPEDLLPHRLGPLPSREPDVLLEAEPLDEFLDRPPQRAVPDQDQLERQPLGGQPPRRLDQQELPLLLGQPPDADQPPRLGNGGRADVEEGAVQPAVDDVDLGPVGGVAPAVELAPAEFAHRHRERRPVDLLAQGELGRPVELARPVDRHAEGDARQDRGEHRHRGRLLADVVVQVLDPLGPEPLGQVGGLEQVGQRPEPPLQARRADPDREPGRGERAARATGGSPGARPSTSRAAPASSMNSVAACSRRISSLTSSRGSGRRIEKVWTVKPRARSCATSPRMNKSLERA